MKKLNWLVLLLFFAFSSCEWVDKFDFDDHFDDKEECEKDDDEKELADKKIIDLDKINPANFSSIITNPYLPMIPGTTYYYSFVNDEGALEEVIEEVTHETKTILGIKCRVVHAREFEDGELTENTFDWYVQDKKGNVWYMGEYSEEIEDGEVVSTDGSWEAGVDGAEPGIIMLAKPKPCVKYRQEYYEGEAEDMAEVVGFGYTVSVPYGTFSNCLKIRETNPLEPGVVEFKFYAPGIGFIQAQEEDGTPTESLVSIEF